MRTLPFVSVLAISLFAAFAHADAKLDHPAADFEKMTLDGVTLRLSSLRGKVVLLDFWASWCEPCKKELPLLAALAAKLKPKGIEIVAVNIDDEPENARTFLKARGVKLTIVDDHDHKIVSLYAPPKMPSSYLIDRAGVVRLINAGFDDGDEQKIEKQLVALSQE